MLLMKVSAVWIPSPLILHEDTAGIERAEPLIGLISHVGGLEERIPAKLRVTKTQTGSTAAFEMG